MNKFFFLAALLVISSCKLVPNRMFMTPPGYSFAKDSLQKSDTPYIIQSNDKFELHIFSNDGFKLVDITQSNISQTASSEGITYEVQFNGEAKLPVIGQIALKGLSIKEAELLLQEKYSKYYKDPFVLIRVVSRHALVFHGDGGKGSVVQLMNDHTSLFEALAMAGGLSDYSKSYKIRIIRGDYRNPQVYLADVSSLEGLKTSELEIYPNDIIYIDSGSNLRKRLTSELVPYLSIITSLLIFVAYINK
jgi:polysaccharide export outer membrane protein